MAHAHHRPPNTTIHRPSIVVTPLHLGFLHNSQSSDQNDAEKREVVLGTGKGPNVWPVQTSKEDLSCKRTPVLPD